MSSRIESLAHEERESARPGLSVRDVRGARLTVPSTPVAEEL